MRRRLSLHVRYVLGLPWAALDYKVCRWADPSHHPAVLHRVRYGLPRLPGDPLRGPPYRQSC